MCEIVKGQPGELNDIIDFADYVFSKAHEPHDFTTLLPKLYGEDAMSEASHYMIKEDESIQAMVCCSPADFTVAGRAFKVYGIGTVSAHPRAKGKGYMRKLMDKIDEDMYTENGDISILGGQRQRYGYWDYYPAGLLFTCYVDETNIRHAYKELDTKGITFEELTQDSSHLTAVYGIYAAQPMSVRSIADFVTVSSTWKAKVYAILKKQKVCGYCIITPGGVVSEFVLSDWTLLPETVKALITEHGSQTFWVAPWETDKTLFLEALAEQVNLRPLALVKVLDYRKTLETFMKLKASYTFLEEGHAVISIGKEIFDITVGGDGITVKEGQDPQAAFTKEDAALYLFSPVGYIPHPKTIGLPRSWFPLPMYIPNADEI